MEDLLMIDIIHKNCKKQRQINIKKYEQRKKEQFKHNIFMFIASGVLFTGLIYLISVIENMRF